MIVNNTIQFISTNYIKEHSQMPVYLDDKYFVYAIFQSQDIEMQQVIGTPLYTTVLQHETAYLQSGTTIPTEYDYLITNFLKPLIMNYSIYRALDSIWAKTMNTSIVIKTDASNARPVTRDEVNIDKNRFLSLAEWWRDSCIRYIVTQNSKYQKFPEWNNFTADPDTVIPDRGRGYGHKGIYFRKGKNTKAYYGPGDTYEYGTRQSGWNPELGNARDNICCG